MPPGASKAEPAAFPFWLLASGIVVILGSAALAVRLVWEMTALSWERGPQMVGFMLMHGPGVLLALCPAVLVIWLVVAIVVVLGALKRRRKPSRASLIAIGLSILLLGILHVPYDIWLRLFVDRWANGPHAGRFFIMAAARGDLPLVKTLVARGMPVDLQGDDNTALGAAAVGGQVEVIRYLLASGADVNALDRMGNSPLEDAIAEHRPEAAKLLAERGGKIIYRGEQQRQ
jgi:hypothetical protein